MDKIQGWLIGGPEYTVFVAGDWSKASWVLDAMECRLHIDEKEYTITKAEANINFHEDAVVKESN